MDEIDQGMDESNQQKMFLKMLESSASDQAPQSFLITPKVCHLTSYQCVYCCYHPHPFAVDHVALIVEPILVDGVSSSLDNGPSSTFLVKRMLVP